MKRSSGLRRNTPLRRKTRLRARSLTNSYRKRPRDLERLRKVKTLPCVVPDLIAENTRTPCAGPVQADHVGKRGIGQKCPDSETASICRKHHRERTDMKGTFDARSWTSLEMRVFCEAAIDLTDKRLAKREEVAR